MANFPAGRGGQIVTNAIMLLEIGTASGPVRAVFTRVAHMPG